MKDLLIANGSIFGMSGCIEEQISTGISLKCYFRDLASLQAAHKDLLHRFPSLRTSVSEVPDQDWNAAWKASMKPALLAPGIWVSPRWLSPPLSQSDCWIKIEPKTAFGTGHHATTRLAAAATLRTTVLLAAGFSLLDIGCGTGVLSFCAEHAGARFVVGIDIDAACAANLAENRADNPSNANGGFAVGTLDIFKNRPTFHCAVMNMLKTESGPLLDHIVRLLLPGGRLLWSGILIEEKDDVIADAFKKGFAVYEETTEDEWWCGAFVKTEGV